MIFGYKGNKNFRLCIIVKQLMITQHEAVLGKYWIWIIRIYNQSGLLTHLDTTRPDN
jgi:hypothetical protein